MGEIHDCNVVKRAVESNTGICVGLSIASTRHNMLNYQASGTFPIAVYRTASEHLTSARW